ncbi:MAG: N-acetylneuraminate synthase family protein [Lachnospira sp.]
MPAYKIASFEINDIPLIEKVAKTGKTIIMSTGIADMQDIVLALDTCKNAGNDNIILLKCVSEYPTPYSELNLRTIANMAETFNCVVGLSDHSMGDAVDVAGITLGARVVEKHLTLRRADGGPDSVFSMEPEEYKKMVENIKNVEKALGKITYELTDKQKNSKGRARSLYVVSDVKKGEIFSKENVKSIRPGYGLHTKYWNDILGKKAKCDLQKGTAMKWNYVE